MLIMSMELWVFSDKQLRSIADWQSAIDAEAYPLQLSNETPFDRLRGFLPSHLRADLTGFECYHDDAAELMHANPDIEFSRAWKYALGLRWVGSDMEGLCAAWMAATAYARATDGVVFDDQETMLRTAVEAREVVREFEQDVLGDV
jgi:hypothetical protein